MNWIANRLKRIRNFFGWPESKREFSIAVCFLIKVTVNILSFVFHLKTFNYVGICVRVDPWNDTNRWMRRKWENMLLKIRSKLSEFNWNETSSNVRKKFIIKIRNFYQLSKTTRQWFSSKAKGFDHVMQRTANNQIYWIFILFQNNFSSSI